MAENRKKPLNLIAFACRTRHFLITEDQDLKVLVALHTVIFKDRHVRLSSYNFDLPSHNIGSSTALVESF